MADETAPPSGAATPAPIAQGTALFGLQGRKALITGGTRGIGRAIAEQLCAAGASVYVCARSADDVAAAVAEMRAQGWDVQVRASQLCACLMAGAMQ